MNALVSVRRMALAVLAITLFVPFSFGQESPCGGPPCPVVYLRQATVVPAEPAAPSWIFAPSTYTHDPVTGARVAQYEPIPPVEPLEDPRLVTSRYHRTRTNLRGRDGSVETIYDVQSWGNGRGGIDAEWERFHDAWKESILSGGYYNQGPGYGVPFGGYGGGFGGGYGFGYGPGNGGYGNGFIPSYGGPQYGMPGYGGPNWNNGGHQSGNGNGSPHDSSHDHDGHGQHDN